MFDMMEKRGNEGIKEIKESENGFYSLGKWPTTPIRLFDVQWNEKHELKNPKNSKVQ